MVNDIEAELARWGVGLNRRRQQVWRADHPQPLIVIRDNGPAHSGDTARTHPEIPDLDRHIGRLLDGLTARTGGAEPAAARRVNSSPGRQLWLPQPGTGAGRPHRAQRRGDE